MSHVEKSPCAAKSAFHFKSKEEKWKNFPGVICYYRVDFERLKNFKVREDDIFVCGFSRSGTTRMQEMVWLIANDFNFEKALQFESDARCPFLE